MAGFRQTWLGRRKLRTVEDYTKALAERQAEQQALKVKQAAAWERRASVLLDGTKDDVRAYELEIDDCRIEIEQLDGIKADLERRLTALRAELDQRRIAEQCAAYDSAVEHVCAKAQSLADDLERIYAPIIALREEGFSAEASALPHPPSLLIDLGAMNSNLIQLAPVWFEFEQAAARSRAARAVQS